MKQDKHHKLPSEVLEFLKENIKTAVLTKLLDNQNSTQTAKNRQIFKRLKGEVLFTRTEATKIRTLLNELETKSRACYLKL
jgi:arginine deiminase